MFQSKKSFIWTVLYLHIYGLITAQFYPFIEELVYNESFKSPNMINNHYYYNNVPGNYPRKYRNGGYGESLEQFPWNYANRFYRRNSAVFPWETKRHLERTIGDPPVHYNNFKPNFDTYNLHNLDSRRVQSEADNDNILEDTAFKEESTPQKDKMVVYSDKYVEVVHSPDAPTPVKSFVQGNYHENIKKLHSNDAFKKMKRYEISHYKTKKANLLSSRRYHAAKIASKYGNGKMCSFMQKNQYEMGDKMMDMACKMYRSWGNNMLSASKWNPTRSQKSWFDSLGSLRAKKRLKRQAQDANGHETVQKKAVRKEYRMLSDEERYRLHRALNVLKNTFMDGVSMYDVFVRLHQANVAPGAHFGPAFLPYHRELLLRFENALREIDQSVSLPYWDSNLDHLLGDDLATQSILWTTEFLGNGIGEVTSGPFAFWQVPDTLLQSENSINRRNTQRILFRNLTTAPPFARTAPELMSDSALLHMLDSKSLRNLSWFVSPVFESNHGAVHNWVGGVMADIPISPTDPVFFMHHAFIDCLWEQLRREQVKQNASFDPRYDFPNDSESLGVGFLQPDGVILQRVEDSHHYSLQPMLPFEPLRNIDGLSNIYFDKFYSCQPSPICTVDSPYCGSQYLFCDLKTLRCAPKLKLGTKCSDFEKSDACYLGQCCHGVCRKSCFEESQLQFNNYVDNFYSDAYF